MRRWHLLGLFAVLIALAPRPAEPVLFDFNSLKAGVNSTTVADGIETYMESMYGSNITVNWGARTMKGKPESGRPAANQLYLANSDNAPDRGPMAGSPYWHADPKDTYLINRWNASQPSGCPTCLKDRIEIIFDEPIISAEFDWEIFPVSSASQKADLTVQADGETIFSAGLSTLPEKKLGDLGHWGPYFFATPVHKLEFIDWTDAPIGIDKLHVTKRQPIRPQSVPVPVPDDAPAVLILAAGFGALVILASRGRRHTISLKR